jgi:hypothetical protein
MPNDKTGNAAQPVTLRRWKVVMVGLRSGTRSRHVWGHDAANDEGRVSDAIVDFKQETMTVTTASGAQFRLAGLPGHSKKGQPVWEAWSEEHGVLVERDVTNDYMDPDDVSTRQFVALNVSAFSTKTE